VSQPQSVLRPEPPQQHRRVVGLPGPRAQGGAPGAGGAEASRWWLMITRLVRGQ